MEVQIILLKGRRKEYKKTEKSFENAIEENDKLALNNLANIYAIQKNTD